VGSDNSGDLHGTEVVRVGDKEVLFAFSKKLVKDTRVHEGVVKIAVARGIPVGLVIIGTLGARKKGLFIDTRIAGLVEGGDAQLLVSIFLDDAKGVLMGIEGGHENEGNIDPAGGIEVLDLPDGEIEEGHVVLDFEGALSAGHAWETTSVARV
jgi:hypothetical protein